MNRRFLAIVAVFFALLCAIGLAGADRPIAEWVHASGFENARVFADPLAALDFVSGMHVWYWLAGSVALALGVGGLLFARRAQWSLAFVAAGLVGGLAAAIGMHVWYWLVGSVVFALGLGGLLFAQRARWSVALVVAALVQFATIGSMIAGKNFFGRLRPEQVLKSGDWTHVWFAGGGSFPSGHGAFYFGLLLPLAAACPRRWQRALLLAIPVFAIVARIDLAKHFLSDVSMSATLAALYGLALATLARRWLPLPAVNRRG